MSSKHVRIEVTGRVQGVGFRYHTQHKALELGVLGYVKNQPNGSVLIEAEGEVNMVDQFIGWCGQGPSSAAVTNIVIHDLPLQGFLDFSIRY